MKKNWLILFSFLLCMGNISVAQQRPNIVFFLVDDMGWQDTSVPFWKDTTDTNRKFHTPNMEKLAHEGVRFTNAYANPVCTPSRVSLLTGTTTARHRVTNWTMYKDTPPGGDKDSFLIAPDWNVNGLAANPGVYRTMYATTLPQLLTNAGYYTILCGKAHFAADSTSGANPLHLGFAKNIAGSAAGNPSSYFSEKKYGNISGVKNIRGIPGLESYWNSGTFLTEALTIEAKKAMDTALQNKQPFFLYMSHYAVHTPFDADKRFIDRYKHLPKEEAAYAALVEGMDKSLGDLMQYLSEKNIADNTIIIFYSDNGGVSRPPRIGKPDTQNLPLRGGKGTLFEGGIRVPAIVKWPQFSKPSAVSEQYIAIQDFFPTIVEMAQIKNTKTVQAVDGKTIVPFLKNSALKDNNRILLWHFPDRWFGAKPDEPFESTGWVSALRKGDWKIMYYYKNEQSFLFNLKDDIGEHNDMSAKFSAKKKKLLQLLTHELKAVNAQLPVNKASGHIVKYPH